MQAQLAAATAVAEANAERAEQIQAAADAAQKQFEEVDNPCPLMLLWLLFVLQCILSPGRAHVTLHLTTCLCLWQILEDTVRLSNLQHIQDLLRQEEFLTTAAAEAAVRERSERAAALDEVPLLLAMVPMAPTATVSHGIWLWHASHGMIST